MMRPALLVLFLSLGWSTWASAQGIEPARSPGTAQPSGGSSSGVVAPPLPQIQRVGATPEMTTVAQVAIGVVGFAAAARGYNTSANH